MNAPTLDRQTFTLSRALCEPVEYEGQIDPRINLAYAEHIAKKERPDEDAES